MNRKGYVNFMSRKADKWVIVALIEDDSGQDEVKHAIITHRQEHGC